MNSMQKKEIKRIYKTYFKYCKYLAFVIFLIVSAYFYKRSATLQKSRDDSREISDSVQGKEEGKGEQVVPSTLPVEHSEGNSLSKDEKGSEDTIYVYICGNIQNPDVYALSKNSRLVTLIDMAGGFTQDADRNILNLAKVLEDGERIYVPSIEEAHTYEWKADTETKSGKIDLNRATKEELMELRGIGASRAEDIIAYRESCGGFQKIEDIMQVSGIKQSVFEKIKDSIEVY